MTFAFELLAKVTESLLIILKSVISLRDLLFKAKSCGELSNLPFTEGWVKEYTFWKQKVTENGIVLKEYAHAHKILIISAMFYKYITILKVCVSQIKAVTILHHSQNRPTGDRWFKL